MTGTDAGQDAGVPSCTTNNGGCSVNATCTPTPGGRTCACNAGYTGDGTSCTSAGSLGGTCVDQVGNPTGYAICGRWVANTWNPAVPAVGYHVRGTLVGMPAPPSAGLAEVTPTPSNYRITPLAR